MNVGMTHFDGLYGILYWSPSCQSNIMDKKIESPLILQHYTNQVQMITNMLNIAQHWQVFYIGCRCNELAFHVGEMIFLRYDLVRKYLDSIEREGNCCPPELFLYVWRQQGCHPIQGEKAKLSEKLVIGERNCMAGKSCACMHIKGVSQKLGCDRPPLVWVWVSGIIMLT